MERDSSQNAQTILTILDSADLSHYQPLFRGVALDTFFNLTDEDLTNLGIDNDEDRKRLLEAVSPYQVNSDLNINDLSLDVGQVLKSTELMLLMLQIEMISIKKNLIKNKNAVWEDAFIEPTVSSWSACRVFLNNINAGFHRMEKLSKEMLLKCGDKRYEKKNNSNVYLISAATLLTILGGIILKKLSSKTFFPYFRRM